MTDLNSVYKVIHFALFRTVNAQASEILMNMLCFNFGEDLGCYTHVKNVE